MVQATVDLPDPLEKAPAGSVASTDDLLAQLAGDEIDRLLAEADVEPEVRAEPAAALPARAPSTSSSESPAPPAAGEPVMSAEEAEGELSSQLGALFQELERPTEAAMAAHSPTQPSPDAKREGAAVVVELQVPAKPTVATPAVAAPGLLPPIDESNPAYSEEAAALAERAASAGDGADDALAAAAALSPHMGEEEADAPLPLLLRPLEWINAPLNACPPAVRDALGKVAIVTMVNALAVLVYVLMFRK